MSWMQLLEESIPAAFGTSFALLLGVVIWLFRKNRERKEVLRRALYNLMVVWEAISRSVRVDAEEVQRAFVKEHLKRSNQLPEEMSTEAAVAKLEKQDGYDPNMLEKLSGKAVRLSVPGGLKRFNERLETVISSLSATEPILAFSLTRDYDIDQLVDNIRELLETRDYALDVEEMDSARYKSMIEYLLTDQMLAGVERNIKRLAWKIGPIVWLRTRWKLWKTQMKHEHIDPERVANIADRVEKFHSTLTDEDT